MYWLGDVGIGVAAVATGAVVLPRYLWFRRRPLPRGCTHLTLPASGTSPRLEVAHLASGHRDVAIVAHGFLKSMRTPALVSTMLALSKQMDVLALDFAGHGHSGGCSRCDFRAAADDLGRVVALAREMGYERIGVVGYSMGAGAAILAAAAGAPISAVAAIAPPARGPSRRPALNDQAVGPLRWWMALMGTRVAPRLQAGVWPQSVVAGVAPVPLLVVQAGRDTLIHRADGEALFAAAKAPKEYVYLPRALHGARLASRGLVVDWLARQLAAAPAAVSPSGPAAAL